MRSSLCLGLLNTSNYSEPGVGVGSLLLETSIKARTTTIDKRLWNEFAFKHWWNVTSSRQDTWDFSSETLKNTEAITTSTKHKIPWNFVYFHGFIKQTLKLNSVCIRQTRRDPTEAWGTQRQRCRWLCKVKKKLLLGPTAWVCQLRYRGRQAAWIWQHQHKTVTCISELRSKLVSCFSDDISVSSL